MKLNDKTIIYIPDGTESKQALARTTHLCIAAHQDDTEFMAFSPIVKVENNNFKLNKNAICDDMVIVLEMKK